MTRKYEIAILIANYQWYGSYNTTPRHYQWSVNDGVFMNFDIQAKEMITNGNDNFVAIFNPNFSSNALHANVPEYKFRIFLRSKI